MDVYLMLEYLKVILTGPVLLALVIFWFMISFKSQIGDLISRILKVKWPWGEFTMQSSNLVTEEDRSALPPVANGAIDNLPQDLTQPQRVQIEQLINSHISNAYLWEYRYLNYFLARSTQNVLDWLAGFGQPITLSHYDSIWLPIIPNPNERSAIMKALGAHHLITIDPHTQMIAVTPKGHEYRNWRGPLASPPPSPGLADLLK